MDFAILVLQAVSLLILGVLAARFLPSYFSKKGENLATKEDIGKTTDEIERVRQQYSEQLEVLGSSLNIKKEPASNRSCGETTGKAPRGLRLVE